MRPALLLLASTAAQDPFSCPCVESSSPLLSFDAFSGSGDVLVDCVDYTPEPGLFVPSHCYPAGYGSSCTPWDTMLPPDCNTTHPPGWCALSWCYVDKDACKTTTHGIQRSVLFPSRRDLFFSYSTCQPENADAFMNARNGANLGGINLVVSIPGLAYPTHFKRIESSSAVGIVQTANETIYSDESIPFEGAIIDYLEALKPFVRQYNITGFTYTWTSRGARASANDGSEWTGAVHEVVNNVADMAASTFWVTTPRTLIITSGRFSAPIDYDHFYLWVRRPSANSSLWTSATRLFEPFGLSLWLVIIGLTFATAVCNLWLGRNLSRRVQKQHDGAAFWAQRFLHHVTETTADLFQTGFQDYPRTRDSRGSGLRRARMLQVPAPPAHPWSRLPTLQANKQCSNWVGPSLSLL